MIPPSSQLNGLSVNDARIYGMPHIGCAYSGSSMSSTMWTGEHMKCAACGQTAMSGHSKHHEPPRSKGTFLLRTKLGQHLLRPALIDLCGSGTTGCHGDRHNGLLKITWEWDCDEDEEKWWSGWYLAHGFRQHDPRFFEHGCYLFTRDGRTKVYRSDGDAQWGRWL